LPWWKRLFIPRDTQRLNAFDPNAKPLTLFHTVLPYALVILALVVGKLLLPAYPLHLPGGIKYTISLYNPGLLFLAVATAYAIKHRLARTELHHIAGTILSRMWRTAGVIAAFVAATQILIHSGSNPHGYPGMLEGIGQLLNKENSLVVSPLIGASGGFLAGSITVSNVMFASLQAKAAVVAGSSVALILCMQLFGATAGNAASLADISALEGTLGLQHQARNILRKLIFPLAAYLGAVIFFSAVALRFAG
jgi:lactate permease